MSDVSGISQKYLEFLKECSDSFDAKYEEFEALTELILASPAVHVFGFGRSGTAALAFTIRLRHFLVPSCQVYWLGDQVRGPIRKGDLVILFTSSGTRKEVLVFADMAEESGAKVAVITGSIKLSLYPSPSLTITLPRMKNGMVYGGGDFELAAWLFQEVFLTYFGLKQNLPREIVDKNHI